MDTAKQPNWYILEEKGHRLIKLGNYLLVRLVREDVRKERLKVATTYESVDTNGIWKKDYTWH